MPGPADNPEPEHGWLDSATPASQPSSDRRTFLLAGLGVVVVGGITTTVVELLPRHSGQMPGIGSGTGANGAGAGSAAAAAGTATSAGSKRTAIAGSMAWKLPKAPAPLVSPAISDGVVYYPGDDFSLFAVDAQSGRITATLPTSNLLFGASPAASGRLVYFADLQQGMLHGYDPQLSPLWTFALGAPISDPIRAPAIVGGTVYIGGYGNSLLHAVDAATGTERWTFTAGDRIVCTPAVSGGIVYAGSRDGNLYAVDVTSGQQVWAFAGNGEFYDSSPIVAGSTVYLGGARGRFYAVDTATGQERWTYQTKSDWRIACTPLVAAGVVYFGTMRGSSDVGLAVFALDAATGQVRWSVPTKGDVLDAPVLADGVLYFVTQDLGGIAPSGVLHAVDAVSGKALWTYAPEASSGDVLVTGPVIGPGVVVVAGNNASANSGNLYGIHR